MGTEKAWKRAAERNMPRMFYISKIDEENSDYYTALHKLQKQFGVSVCPIVVPIFEGNRDTVGVVDCVIRKAYKMEGTKRVEIPIPDNMVERIDQHPRCAVRKRSRTERRPNGALLCRRRILG